MLGPVEKTNRGFELVEFKDLYDKRCSLQQSSLATDAAIWLGCDDAEPRVLIPGEGWQPVAMPANYIANTRMHLNQDQVRELVSHLQRWLDTGSFNGE